MEPLGTAGAHDPDRRRRFRRKGTPDVRPVAVRDALRRLRSYTPEATEPGERHPLERNVRSELRASN